MKAEQIDRAPLLTEDDLLTVREGGLIERQALVIRLVEEAYERGWDDCAEDDRQSFFDRLLPTPGLVQ